MRPRTTGREEGTEGALPWLMGRLREVPAARRLVLAAVGIGTAAGLLIVVQAHLIARIVDGAVMDGADLRRLTPLFAALAAVAAGRAVLAWAREPCGFQAGAAVRRQVRGELLEHMTRLGPAYTEGRETGVLAAAVLEQVDALQGFYAHFLPQTALAVLVPAVIVCAVFPVSWAAGGLLLVTAPLIPLFMVLVGMGAESISQRNFEAMARLGAHFLDTLQGMTSLKLFGRSRGEERAVAQAARRYRRRTMQVLRVAFLSSAVLEFFAALSIALVAIYLGLRYLGYIGFGTWGAPLTLYDGLLILVLAPDFYQPLRELGAQYHARAEAMGAAAEIRSVLSAPARGVGPARGGPRPRPGTGAPRVRCREVSVRYPGREGAALTGVSFELAAGEHAALVGASGSGKTSVLKLLLRFVEPEGGEMALDGVDHFLVAPDDWRKAVSWVGQEPALFYGTIRGNILSGDSNADETRLLRAARTAGVAEFAGRLPLGMDTPVGERGVSLSRGQAQRVALARALVKDAPVLLLDEPTAGLDRDSEARVLQALRNGARDRTVLMTTHRLAGLESMDRIIVLDNGRIAAQGTYAQLIGNGGPFSALLRRTEGGRPR